MSEQAILQIDTDEELKKIIRQLESMSKEDLVALAKDMGVELPRGAAKALIVEKLAAVTVQAPVNDGSAQ